MIRLLTDGYDVAHMKLGGRFSYRKSDQRVLAFDTAIKALSPEQTQFAASSSKSCFDPLRISKKYHVM